MFPALKERGALMLEDVGGPLPLSCRHCIQGISAARQIANPVVAHFGDGNTHPTILFDATDQTAKEHGASAFTDIMELAVSLGGTITGEHRGGRLKKALFTIQLGPRVTETKQLKRSSGPGGPLELRSSAADFVLEVDPDDLIE